MAACDPNQIFPRSVFRDMAAYDLGNLDHEPFGQIRPVGLGEVRHDVEVARAPVIDPLPDLVHPHPGLFLGSARLDKRVPHPVAGEPDEIHRPLRKLPGDRQDVLCDRGRGLHRASLQGETGSPIARKARFQAPRRVSRHANVSHCSAGRLPRRLR